MDISHYKIKQEITPILSNECFILFERQKHSFDFPIHFHSEYELNCIIGGKGAIRVIGNKSYPISNYELVLTGPNSIHGWLQGNCDMQNVQEKTLQFQGDLFDKTLLNRNLLAPIEKMLSDSLQGISFSEKTCKTIFNRIESLKNYTGIDSFIELLSILNILQCDYSRITLQNQNKHSAIYKDSIMKSIYKYIQLNYNKKLNLCEVSDTFNMSNSTLNRIVKRNTGSAFVDFLIDFRLGIAGRKLKETDNSITQIAEECGFTNLSNFNRLFLRNYKATPRQFRKRNDIQGVVQ